jgi:outer membrane protein
MRKGYRQTVLAAASAAVLMVGTAGTAFAETLPEAIALAYQSNPTLLSQRAQLRAQEETYEQARGGSRPSLSLGGTSRYNDPQGSAIGTYTTNSASLTASQAVYTGGRTAGALRMAEAQVLAARQGLRRVEAGVMQTVIQAYIDVRRDGESLKIRQENVAVLKRQLDEAKARFDVGEITKTDVNQAAARYAGSKALLAAAEAQLAASRAAYTANIGQAPGDLAPEPELTQLPATVDLAFTTAERNSPVLLQADYTEQGSNARVAAARAERMPNLSLQAQLAFTDQSRVLSQGSGSGHYDRDVTAAAVFTQPLVAGGVINSRVRQAIELNASDRLQLDYARRSVVQAVSQAWAQLLATRSSITANEEQVRATEIAFEGTKQENQVGLRTTLDVLNAEQELRNAELALVNARRDSYLAAAQLLNAMGALEIRNLNTAVTPYDDKSKFNRRKNGLSLTPWDRIVETVDGVGGAKIQQREMLPDAPIAANRP